MAKKTLPIGGTSTEPLMAGASPRLEKKRRFIRALAEFLAGSQAKRSIELQMRRPEAIEWAKLRQETPLFGYQSIDEAEAILLDFLG